MQGDDPRSDEELIEAINDGDDAAFEVVYWRYRDWVVRLARRFVGNDQDALDVLQETFAYFIRKFPGFELRAKLTTFFYPVVKNLSLAVRRKRRPMTTDDELLDRMPAEQSEQGSSSRAELASVMSCLSAGHREVLLMRFVDGMSLEEIAQSLQIPLGTVKSRMHNGLDVLRNDPRMRNYFRAAMNLPPQMRPEEGESPR